MIRLLNSSDTNAYRDLRLLALKTDPISFVSTFDSESRFSHESFTNKLIYSSKPPMFGFYGFFDENSLIANIQLARETLAKSNHIANIFELYVHPNHRKKGLATTLLNHLIKKTKSLDSIEQIHLRANSSNADAINLYKKLGFTHQATRKNAIKENDNSYQHELLFTLYLNS